MHGNTPTQHIKIAHTIGLAHPYKLWIHFLSLLTVTRVIYLFISTFNILTFFPHNLGQNIKSLLTNLYQLISIMPGEDWFFWWE